MSGRVAVIAVHGVADQPPFATARATADLLKCHLGDKASEFREMPLRIEVHPLRVTRPAEGSPASGEPKGILAATAQVGREAANAVGSSSKPDPSTMWHAGVDLDCDTPRASAVAGEAKRRVSLMAVGGVQESIAELDERERKEILDASFNASDGYYEKQLSEYRQQPADAVYETVCLSSTVRRRRDGVPKTKKEVPETKVDIVETKVDVLEMYWADLSRVQSAFLQAVEELYYVLFAVCNIGRMELERSRALFTNWRWKWLRRCEGFAERVLTLFVPLGNACLLLLLVFTLPHLLPDEFAVESRTFLAIVGSGVGLLVGAIVFVLTSHRRPDRASCFLLIGVLGGGVGYGIGCLPHPECIRFVLAVLLWLVSFLVLCWLSLSFNKRQPGALWVGLILGLLVFVPVWREAGLRTAQKKYWALDIGLATAEWVLFGLMLVWLAYLGAAALCSLFGWWAVCHERTASPRRKTAARIVWTANLAILAPGLLFIVLNLGIWQALYTGYGYLMPKMIPAALSHKPAGPYADWLHGLDEIEKRAQSRKQAGVNAAADSAAAETPKDFSIKADRVPSLLIRNSALPLVVAISALILMLLATAWLLLPAILAEGATASDPEHEYARGLGNSLSFAWRGMRWCAEWLVRGQVFLLILFCCGIYWSNRLAIVTGFDLKGSLFEWGNPVLWIVGWLFVFLASGANRFKVLRNVVDVAADVANWLRLHPRDNNPTSRISARYVSLLRYVAQRKDEHDNPYYDRVVIFAHSLGSAITVDLLQFLRDDLQKPPDTDGGLERFKGGGTDKLPVYLFTHGCPLRQLLGLRLPLTYGWAWHGSKDWYDNEEPAGNKLLGVKQWVNAYCSGDYVGRYLWHDDVDDVPWDASRRVNDAAHNANHATVPRVELCVGAGAHVHYWDLNPQSAGAGANGSSAPSTKIAKELVTLIG